MDVSKHLEKAAEAVRKKNFDYAISLYHQVLTLKPDHGDARRDLRQALVRRAEYKKIGSGIALMSGLHHRVGLGLGKATKNPDQVVRACEGYLKNDPKNGTVNRALAEALEAAGHNHSAVVVWEFMSDDEQLGDYALKRAGTLYYQMKKMAEALGCYETVLKRSPRDSEAEKMRKNLAAEGVLSSGSYDPTRSSRDQARDKEGQRTLEASHKIVTTEDERTLLARSLQEKLDADPSQVRARRDLVDHYLRGREYDEAIALLEQGVALDEESYELRERLGDVRILALEAEIRKIRALASKGDPAAETDLIDLEREKFDFEVEEFSRRVSDHPTDLALRYKLGHLQLQAGEVASAIENFQHSVKDPRRRIDSLMGLGQAFEQNGKLELARKQLDQALEGIDSGSERATEVNYLLGCLAEKEGDYAAAKTRFEGIYERDIHYRDVASRLDRIAAKASPAAPERVTEAENRPKVEAPPAVERKPAAEPPEPKQETNESDEGSSSDIYDFKD